MIIHFGDTFQLFNKKYNFVNYGCLTNISKKRGRRKPHGDAVHAVSHLECRPSFLVADAVGQATSENHSEQLQNKEREKKH